MEKQTYSYQCESCKPHSGASNLISPQRANQLAAEHRERRPDCKGPLVVYRHDWTQLYEYKATS